MLADYLGILVILAAGVILVGGMLAAHGLLRPKRDAGEPSAAAGEAVPPDARTAERFVLFASLFVVFEAAAFLIYPWAVSFRQLEWFGYGAALVFVLPLTVGLAYQWLKGGLEW